MGSLVNTGIKHEEVGIRCGRCMLAGSRTGWQLKEEMAGSHIHKQVTCKDS